MQRTRSTIPVVTAALLAATALPAAAAPDESQRLRGMGDRSFAVDVMLPDGTSFPNCYTFEADGTWLDGGVPVPGTWSQDGVGARTTYSAAIQTPFGPIEQRGEVTPAGGGTLQLEARTTVPGALLGAPTDVTLVSTGAEVASCD